MLNVTPTLTLLPFLDFVQQQCPSGSQWNIFEHDLTPFWLSTDGMLNDQNVENMAYAVCFNYQFNLPRVLLLDALEADQSSIDQCVGHSGPILSSWRATCLEFSHSLAWMHLDVRTALSRDLNSVLVIRYSIKLWCN